MVADTLPSYIVVPHAQGTATSAPGALRLRVPRGYVDSGPGEWTRITAPSVGAAQPAHGEADRVARLFGEAGIDLASYRQALEETGYDARPSYAPDREQRDRRIMTELGPARARVNREVLP